MQDEIFDPNDEHNEPENKGKKESRVLGFWIVLIILFVIILSTIGKLNSDDSSLLNTNNSPTPTPIIDNTILPTKEVISTITQEPETISTPTTLPPTEIPLEGIMAFSIMEAGYSHIFAYSPETNIYTRLTIGEANDIDPQLSPDGSQIAFSSDREGHSDIYIMDLISGETLAVTDDLPSDSHPSWSADGLWLAFQRFQNNNLDIFIHPTDLSIPPIQITFDLGSDFSPSWHPNGKTIAFTSSRSGNLDIWTINIEDLGNEGYLQQITTSPQDDTNPEWSPNGDLLAWSSPNLGFPTIYVDDPLLVEGTARLIGRGMSAAWSPNGNYLITNIRTPNKGLIAFYKINTQPQLLNTLALDGSLAGMDWGPDDIPSGFPENILSIANQDISFSWNNQNIEDSLDIFGRQKLSAIENIIAPNPQFNQLVIPQFNSLRQRMESELGWDLLADLENVFVPLTEKLPPGLDTDWLYTGRAFSLNQAIIRTQWVNVVREEIGNETYWRIYAKPLTQDGSKGMPMTQYNWNFLNLSSNNGLDISQVGNENNSISSGYWVDFTAFAQAYGWDRQPALENWTHYYPGIQFNLFAAMNGLSWQDAMLQIYPPETFFNSLSGVSQ